MNKERSMQRGDRVRQISPPKWAGAEGFISGPSYEPGCWNVVFPGAGWLVIHEHDLEVIHPGEQAG